MNKSKIFLFKLFKIPIKIRNYFDSINDNRLLKTINIRDFDGNNLFRIYDFGPITRYRASSFFYKEPETLEWIRNFEIGDVFLDVGANIGIYSLYAGVKGIETIAIEPDALNNALLNLNINKNSLSQKVTSFSLALHDHSKYSSLNIGKLLWGGALNSFDNCVDQFNQSYTPDHKQGVYGDSLDNFLIGIKKKINHLKIDVDGNEELVLKGAKKTLASPELKSLLIELDVNHPKYYESIRLIESNGFYLKKKTNAILDKTSRFITTFNHIFIKNSK